MNINEDNKFFLFFQQNWKNIAVVNQYKFLYNSKNNFLSKSFDHKTYIFFSLYKYPDQHLLNILSGVTFKVPEHFSRIQYNMIATAFVFWFCIEYGILFQCFWWVRRYVDACFLNTASKYWVLFTYKKPASFYCKALVLPIE